MSEKIEEAFELLKRGDHDKAFEILLPIAEDGDADAQFYIGIIYQERAGDEPEYPDDRLFSNVERDDNLGAAAKMFKSAADQGLTEAKFAFARICVTNVIPPDFAADPFTIYSHDDVIPYLESAVIDGHEDAKLLLDHVIEFKKKNS
jgi:TPR repeat protein